ncbi:classical arabinogalactan protein 4 [Luteimonas salinilitoris]|uniref:Classical arabinogalactan protein 4 n=1 Tax=Luteimonas salinilitoris TaxID=3237697 RepID=A0ABV4HRT7_9GAMM
MHLKPFSLCLLLPLLAAAGAACAQVGEPRQPPARIETVPVRPPPARVAADLSARPRQEIAIPATGPSPMSPRPGAPATKDATSRVDPAAPAKVYDRTGRLIPGAVRVGPNRVFDPRSGRYRTARPRGDDLQVVPEG